MYSKQCSKITEPFWLLFLARSASEGGLKNKYRMHGQPYYQKRPGKVCQGWSHCSSSNYIGIEKVHQLVYRKIWPLTFIIMDESKRISRLDQLPSSCTSVTPKKITWRDRKVDSQVHWQKSMLSLIWFWAREWFSLFPIFRGLTKKWVAVTLTCLVDKELVLSPRIWGRSHGTYRNTMNAWRPLLLELRSSEVGTLWWKNVIVVT